MKALIVDDERYARMELARLLKEHPEVDIVGEAANAREARERISFLKPDLVFLDIQMPEETGLELLNSLGEECPQVIFTTAYDTYALRAFDFGVVDYLLKPIVPKRLAVAIKRVLETGADYSQSGEGEKLSGDLPSKALAANDKVLIGSGSRIWYVAVDTVIGAESLGAYSKIWLRDAAPVIRRSLTLLEKRLPSEIFMRANRSQIVNLQHVQKVEPWFSGGLKVALAGGYSVEFSRRHARSFRGHSTL